jgi:hypothetical protein
VNHIGWVVLGVIAEGCCDALRQGLAEILPSLLLSVQDQESYVRECACFALGKTLNLSSPAHVMIILQHYHEFALAGRSKYFKNQNNSVDILTICPIHGAYIHSYYVSGQLSEYCQPEILHYHQTVLPIVFQALEVRTCRYLCVDILTEN